MEINTDLLKVENSVKKIFNFTGHKMKTGTATALSPKILKHKWYLSRKLGRDIGTEVACLDFITNVQPVENHENDFQQAGEAVSLRTVWDTISETQPPKQIVNKRIILPLTAKEIARKHNVIPPKTIIFFGPPGTGKTYFVKGIAGVLKWRYVEITPSSLMNSTESHLSANLKKQLERIRGLDEAVIFIDEFEEIAGNRIEATLVEKSTTNEFLKQVPLFKNEHRKTLLICATNHIRQLDPALLRPGRFDCIIPVGSLDEQARLRIFKHYLSQTNHGEVDLGRIVAMTDRFTPADIEYLFQKIKQEAFEREMVNGSDYAVSTEMFLEIIPGISPTLNDEILREFEQDCKKYTRY